MNRRKSFTHVFVDQLPDQLEDGVLYVSIMYSTVAHRCACGCGEEVVTPLSPTDWRLIFDGESVSLEPSIGNWSLACRSHYWIAQNHVQWSSAWTQQQIERGRQFDRLQKQDHYQARKEIEHPLNQSQAKRGKPPSAGNRSWFDMLRWWR